MTITNLPDGLNVTGGLTTDTLTVSGNFSFTNLIVSGTESNSSMLYAASGGTVSPTGAGVIFISGSSDTTINFPSSPNDGQYFSIVNTTGIFNLTLVPGAGQTINGTVSSISGFQAFQWIYRAATTTWYRLLWS
jgi:hypothetical protein